MAHGGPYKRIFYICKYRQAILALYKQLERCQGLCSSLHCNENPIYVFPEKGNCASYQGPISTLLCLWVIYIFPGSVHIFPAAEQADPSWEYLNCSQTHECGNWDCGRAIYFLGVYVSNFRYWLLGEHFYISLTLSWIYKTLLGDGCYHIQTLPR
jgi:hypothetical protein